MFGSKNLRDLFLYCIFLTIVSSVKGNCKIPNVPSSISVDCYNENGSSLRCGNRSSVSAKTNATFECKPHYCHSLNNCATTKRLTCQADGNWSGIREFSGLSCYPVCGHNYTSILSGQKRWPSYALIFYEDENSAETEFLCGGSLINPWGKGFAVLATANCVTKYSGRRGMLPEDYVQRIIIVLGGDNARFEQNFDGSNETIAKSFTVKSVSIPGSYYSSNFTGGNIALLKIKEEVELTDAILPGCLSTYDIASAQLMAANIRGNIVGFKDLDNARKPDGSVGSAEVDILKDEECSHLFPTGVPKSQFFCGKFIQMCGDSSSGLAISQENPEKFYIQGLVAYPSTNESCRNGTSTTVLFTKLSSYGAWLVDQLDSNGGFKTPVFTKPVISSLQPIVLKHAEIRNTRGLFVKVEAALALSLVLPGLQNATFA